MIKKDQIELLTQAIEMGLNDTDSCEQAGINRTWFYEKQNQDPKFALIVSKARTKLKVRNLALIQRASLKQWQAAAWMLERKHPEEFSIRQRVELSGPEGKAIAVSDIDGMSKEELERLHEKMDRILRDREEHKNKV